MEDTHTEHQPLIDQEMSRQEEEHQVPETHEEEERRPVVLYKGIQQREASQLQCPIHKGLMHDPVGTGKCKHVFCRSCLASWAALQGHCPLDARPAQLVPADAAVEKLNSLLIHCRWGVVQDEETGAWVAASGEGYCPALITIGDRKAHEDSCAYCPAVLQSDEATGRAAGQLMNRLQFPQVQVNVEVMHALREEDKEDDEEDEEDDQEDMEDYDSGGEETEVETEEYGESDEEIIETEQKTDKEELERMASAAKKGGDLPAPFAIWVDEEEATELAQKRSQEVKARREERRKKMLEQLSLPAWRRVWYDEEDEEDDEQHNQ
ncbi:uncharacterized protein ACA1_143570 [Acanthamoeba castellanii str. Neff]|uniref:RING-type domain-containing protein n=1 Tax=Acanthamoeba castellanii (strain ATCC 30010 / Neff) TaxID=1257118 RepID=L8HFF2_ACACF|nr:uncharacterized protein ACA1_143570 [Acanthamoeba castellanii str. Neff]ELR23977.1 hypothetical protein ACA1_143570 [Acanthamoeba castellanii str. Neff]